MRWKNGSLILENSQPSLFQMFSLCALSFCNSNSIYIRPFNVVSQLLDTICFPILFTLCFSVWLISTDLFLSSLIQFLTPVELLMSPLKEFFISVTVLFISSNSIWLFLIVFISQLKLPIWYCMLSTFSIIALNILITVIWNSCLIVTTSVSYLSLFLMITLCLPSVIFFLPLCMAHLNIFFLLKTDHLV